MIRCMLTRTICGLLTLAGVMMTGCSDNTPPDPPLARAELTSRLYDTLRQGRDADALAIIEKLLALDPDDADLLEMQDRITANICARAMQANIDQNQLDEALKLVQQYRKQYPMLTILRVYENEIADLIKLRDAASELAAANDVVSLAAALEKIAPMAAKYTEAKQLQTDIKIRKNDLAKMRSQAAAAAATGSAVPAGKAQ